MTYDEKWRCLIILLCCESIKEISLGDLSWEERLYPVDQAELDRQALVQGVYLSPVTSDSSYNNSWLLILD